MLIRLVIVYIIHNNYLGVACMSVRYMPDINSHKYIDKNSMPGYERHYYKMR